VRRNPRGVREYDTRSCTATWTATCDVTHKWVMSHISKSCHMCISHVTFEWVVSYIKNWRARGWDARSCTATWRAHCVTSHTQSHVTCIYVTSHMNSYITYRYVSRHICNTVAQRRAERCVTSHMSASCHVWQSYGVASIIRLLKMLSLSCKRAL